MRIAILGFSREGVAALDFLRKQKIVFGQPQKKIEYTILDKRTPKNPPKGIRCETGTSYLDRLDQFDYIVRSPGVPYLHPKLVRARKKGVIITSATKLFFSHCPGKIIGITGTKGKGTTATILYKILKTAKKDVFLVGNIGTPALTVLPKIKKGSLIVFELSSFQLQDLTQSPPIAIVLGMAPDHLDSHKTMKEYVAAKSQIAKHQKKNDWLFYVAENKWARSIATQSSGHAVPVKNDSSLVSYADLRLPAPHLLTNTTIAAKAAQRLGCSKTVIKKAIRNFSGYEHRLEFVREKNGIAYYNDSASTNPIATIAAIESFPKPIILIAGGKNKGMDYRSLGKAIDKNNVKLTIVMGQIAPLLQSYIKKKRTVVTDSLNEALRIAREEAVPGDTVLFSPGATSLDMFRNYEERGLLFKKAVTQIK